MAHIRYASVCSGVEAPTLAWHKLGWRPVWFSEIDKFPSEVLRQRYPEVPNLGDMTKLHQQRVFNETEINLLVGGTPCQSFSVAGLRKGLSDDRGNLALEYVRILQTKRPDWFIWENVPGVFSSNGGRDFRSILTAFASIGYVFSWRVIDVQKLGVPQRRKRVFVVGHIRDWRYTAAVLFDGKLLSEDSRQSDEEGKDSTETSPGSSGVGSQSEEECGRPSIKAYAYSKSHRANGNVDIRFTEDGKANTLTTGDGCGNQSSLNLVVHPIQYGSAAGGKSQSGVGVGLAGDPMYTLTRQDVHGVGLIYPYNQITNKDCRSNPKPGDPSPTLMASKQAPLYTTTSAVRRLTPIECERLQGFPDNHTNILWVGKDAPDGYRYKAAGNSMAVPVMEWIGRRIDMVEDIINAERYL